MQYYLELNMMRSDKINWKNNIWRLICGPEWQRICGAWIEFHLQRNKFKICCEFGCHHSPCGWAQGPNKILKVHVGLQGNTRCWICVLVPLLRVVDSGNILAFLRRRTRMTNILFTVFFIPFQCLRLHCCKQFPELIESLIF